MPSGGLIPPTKKTKRRSSIGALALKKAKEPKKLIFIGAFLIIVILIFAFYGIIKGYQSSLNKKIIKLEEENVDLEKEKADLMKNGELSGFQLRVGVVEGLVDKHVYWQDVFDFLEETTLSKVYYRDFDGSLETKTIKMSGTTTNFEKLAEQIILLKNHEQVEEIKLMSFRGSEEGVVFSFQILLDPELWANSEETYES